MDNIEILADLCSSVNFAIKSGDWKVDGRNDPDYILSVASATLEQEGWHLDGITGDEWLEDLTK